MGEESHTTSAEIEFLRDDIEETRARMAERADALAYKSDVPARSKDKLHSVTDKVKEKVTSVLPQSDHSDSPGFASGAADSVKDGTAAATDSVKGGAAAAAHGLQSGAQHTKTAAANNPLAMAGGALALGFLAGLLAPTTRLEHEKLGPVSQDLKSRAATLGSEALERGKSVAADTAAAAKEAATDAAASVKETASSSAAEESSGFSESAQSETAGFREKVST